MEQVLAWVCTARGIPPPQLFRKVAFVCVSGLEEPAALPSTSYLCLHSLLTFHISYVLHVKALCSSPSICTAEVVYDEKAGVGWDLSSLVLTKGIGSFFELQSKSCWKGWLPCKPQQN